jgi:hypothetical protein
MVDKKISITYSLINQVTGPLNEIKSSVLTTAASFATGQIAADGLREGFEKLKELVGDSIKKFDDSALSAIRLKTAVGAGSEAIIQYAEERQKATRFEHEAIENAAALLGTYGLTEKQIMKLLPGLMDMASVTDKDLVGAAEKAGRSITTTMNALGRSGIILDDSRSKSERLAEVVEQLDKRFRGQAEAAGNVGAGQMVKFDHSVDELKESIGGFLLASTPLVPFLKEVTLLLNNMSASPLEKELNKAEDAQISYFNDLVQAKKELAENPGAQTEKDMVIVAQMNYDIITKKVNDLIKKREELSKLPEVGGKKGSSDNITDFKAEESEKAKEMKAAAESEYKLMKLEYERKEKLQADYIEFYNKNIEDNLVITQRVEQHEIDREKKKWQLMTGFAQDFAMSLTAGIGKGSDGMKESFKAVLTTTLSFLEKELLASTAMAAIRTVYGDFTGLLAMGGATLAFEGAKAGINSFQTSPGQWKQLPGSPNQGVLVMAHGGEIGRPGGNTTNNNNMGGIHLHLPESSTITTAGARLLANTLEQIARDGHMDRAFAFKQAMA